MAIYALGERVPSIHPSAYVHPDAVVIGSVTIGAESGIWPTAVLRGDHGTITIGEQTSIQDGTVIHTTELTPTVIGDRCTVGHNTHLEGCIIDDDCLIGSGSVVLNGAHIQRGALVGAGAVVSYRTVVPPRAMALGVPAKIKEDAVAEGAFTEGVAKYVHNTHWYKAELRRLD